MSSPSYHCKHCNYRTDKKFLMKQHLGTLKHKSKAGGFICDCGKIYKHRQSYTRHRKKCSLVSDENAKNITNHLAMVVEDIREENKSLHKMFESFSKQVGTGTTINNSFNVNVFLNSHCKDAIDINDFIDGIEFDGNSMKKLVGNSTHTVTQALVKELKGLDIGKRPIHCTDAKREVLYVKDQGVWEKDSQKQKLKTALDVVSIKHANAIRASLEDCDQSEYCNLIQNMTSPVVKSQVIKGLIRNVMIDKAHKVSES